MEQGALKELGEEKLRAFLRQVRHGPEILACRLVNEALDAGVPLAALFTAEAGYSATVARAQGGTGRGGGDLLRLSGRTGGRGRWGVGGDIRAGWLGAAGHPDGLVAVLRPPGDRAAGETLRQYGITVG